MLTAQPQTGRERAGAGHARRCATPQMLERGITMRTLYQHSARRSSITHKYVAAVTARGAEVRTLDEFFNRMIVIDRRVAVIPDGDSSPSRSSIREPADRRLPGRRVRAGLGARPAVHQPRGDDDRRRSPPSSGR